jgi:hypothetical protein
LSRRKRRSLPRKRVYVVEGLGAAAALADAAGDATCVPGDAAGADGAGDGDSRGGSVGLPFGSGLGRIGAGV